MHVTMCHCASHSEKRVFKSPKSVLSGQHRPTGDLPRVPSDLMNLRATNPSHAPFRHQAVRVVYLFSAETSPKVPLPFTTLLSNFATLACRLYPTGSPRISGMSLCSLWVYDSHKLTTVPYPHETQSLECVSMTMNHSPCHITCQCSKI